MSIARRYFRPQETAVAACPVCGKWRYVSRSAAKAEARRKQSQTGGSLNRVYKCGDYWHLTSNGQTADDRQRWWQP